LNFQCHRKVKDYYNSLPDKSKRIIREHIERLKDYPDINGDIECYRKSLHSQLWRMHIARSFTLFYTVDTLEGVLRITDLMTIEQAHKKYNL